MTRVWQICYRWLAFPLMWGLAHLAALKNRNLKAGLQGRKGLWKRLEAQLAERDVKRPLIWFHVASAGEFLQAQPVLERCLEHGFECAVTLTSVNGYTWIQRATFPKGLSPLVKEYLPLDSVANMRRMLHMLKPALLVYVKYDLWPNLIWEAHAAGIPQYLISATLQPHSKRTTSWLGPSLYRDLYACLDGILTVTEADQQRFLRTNPQHPNIHVVGDTRYDSVLDRKQRLTPPQLPEAFTEQFVFIMGSSWPPDEECVFPALREALRRHPELCAILAPHEPTPGHLRHSETFFQDFPMLRLTHLAKLPAASPSPRLILVDTVGVLSSLYAVGTLAYVGGAFTTGVHNVMEPGAMGLPVIFGPKHQNSPEAVALREQGLAFAIHEAAECEALLLKCLRTPQRCRELGQRAAAFIEQQAGAADQSFSYLKNCIE